MQYREVSSTLMLPFDLRGEAIYSIRQATYTNPSFENHFLNLGLKVSEGNGVYCIEPRNVSFSSEDCDAIFATLSIIAPCLYMGGVITFSGNEGLLRFRITSAGRAVREIAKWVES